MDGKQRSELIRLEARLSAFEDIKAEIGPWLMEERDESAREALTNVIAHLDAEIIELHCRREEIEGGTQLHNVSLAKGGKMYSHILVAIDESTGSGHAVEHAAGLARGLSATLRIVHVVDMGWLPLGPELAIDIEAIAKVRRTAGEKILLAARETALAAGVEAETRLLETTTPTQRIAAAIADEAANWPADVVVLGTHGRRVVERVLLGSVAEGVARLSTVPVLLIPRPETGR